MVKFVWLEAGDGSKVPVNPEQVTHVRRTAEGKTAVVFGMLAGGFDQLVVKGDGEEVVRQLEGEPRLKYGDPAPKPRSRAKPA
jgi:hypothetical protein